MTSTHYRIEPDGCIKAVTVTEKEISLEQSILNKFAADSPVRTDCLLSAAILPGVAGLDNIRMCMRRTAICFTVRMASIPMRTPFTMKHGVMVPQFKADGDTEFNMTWKVPENMRLYFMANFVNNKPDTQFMVAVDPPGRTYRLPLSNLYEDARLCHGTYPATGSTLIDMLCKAWEQFHKSRWQSHLMDKAPAIEANSQKLFRFKPSEGDGFEQQPIVEGNTWESLSQRVSTAFINENIVV